MIDLTAGPQYLTVGTCPLCTATKLHTHQLPLTTLLALLEQADIKKPDAETDTRVRPQGKPEEPDALPAEPFSRRDVAATWMYGLLSMQFRASLHMLRWTIYMISTFKNRRTPDASR